MNELYHYGIPRRSGRYPYGSGDRPYQSEGGRVNTDTLRIRSLDRKINRISRSRFKNREMKETSLKNRREQLIARDKDSNSNDLEVKRKAQIERARDNSHLYTNTTKNISIASAGAIAISGVLSGDISTVLIGSAYVAYDSLVKKAMNKAIDKVADKALSKYSSQKESIIERKDYEKRILEVLDEKPEVVNDAVRKYIESDYRKQYKVGSNDYWGISKEQLKEYTDADTESFFNYLKGMDKTKPLPDTLIKAIDYSDQYRDLLTKKDIKHSAKGSVWENHKYVKKIDGVYYYPVGYEDGRTIDELSDRKKKDDSSKESNESIDKQIDQVKHHFDEYLKERGIDWRTLPKDEVDEMQRHIVSLLEGKKEGRESSSSDKSDAKKMAEKLMEAKKESASKNKSTKKESSEKKETEDKKKEDEEKKKKKSIQTSSTNNKKKVDMSKVWAVYRNKNSIEIKRAK